MSATTVHPPSLNSFIGAGIVLMRRPDALSSEPRFLLLRGISSAGIWSFSKGHPESQDGGDPFQTALRETFEETGYVLHRDYSLISSKSMRLGKRPYWIGVMKSSASLRPRLQKKEHNAYGWFSLSEAKDLNSNTDVRHWIKKAQTPYSYFSQLINECLGVATTPSCSSSSSSTWTRHSSAPECIAS